ncbi:MAG: ABC transporter ATP-binding protein [Erysipelotrichaceae bacterium]|nr:ABC transporter ATP-binding protein [Erysipelotrichaceae bacterium]
MNKQSVTLKTIWKTLKPYIAPYQWGYLIAVGMVLLTCVVLSLTPTVEGEITSALSSDVMAQRAIRFDVILHLLMILLGLCALKTIAQVIEIFFLTDAIQHAMHDLRDALQKKIRKLPVRYFDNRQVGDILSVITNDVDTLSNALQQSFINIISGVMTLCLAIYMMSTINWNMTLIALFLIPTALLITKLIVHRSQRKFRAQQQALGRLNGTITELYGGFNEIVLYNRQKKAMQDFQTINSELQANAFAAQFMSSLISPLISLCTYLTIGTVAVVGSIYAIRGGILVGQLQAFIRYIWQVNDPLSQVSNLSAQIQSAFAAIGRIVTLLCEEEEIKEAQPAQTIAHVKGNVSFQHVHFGYGEQPIIQDFSVDIKAGQMVAIVGPTGAGKTTLINLLERFYDVNSGRITIDGVDIRDLTRHELRSIFGMVLQDTWLFSGTIYDNIRYGRLDARKDEVIAAAKRANVHHFIRTLPEGYDMVLNEEGSNISQGEKQLLTIARAFLKDPQILILDEATSSVDTRLEKMLQEAMQNVLVGRTAFVIAHRLSTIRNADMILVLQNGNIVEQGTHEQLMKQNGAYAALYQSQFAHEENA